MAKKVTFLKYVEPFPEALKRKQAYHRMRHPIAQQLLGVRGSQLKTGGSYGQNTDFCHVCRVFQ